MEDKIKAFIEARLRAKGIVAELQQEIIEPLFYRFFYTEGQKPLVFTLIPDTPEARKSWYESVYFDNSMDSSRRKEILAETPIDSACRDYFKQEFYIGKHDMLLRWS